jgi:DNA polymerase-3 subunit delta'
MREPVRMEYFAGNRRVVEILLRAIGQQRLPHAMIFAGQEGIGKCTLALLLAQVLNCLSPENHSACGKCASCRKIGSTLASRNLACENTKEDGFCGVCPSCRLKMQKHPDVRLIEPEKTTIAIDQIRELIEEVAFQPFEARYRVVILDPADRMKAEAQNSLLKTLEEPSSRTVFILVTTNPYMLLDTIRSRSRLIQFGEIPRETIETYLISNRILSSEDARLASTLCGGSLSKAMNFDAAVYRDVRDRAFQFVALLLRGGDFENASSIAEQVSKDKKSFPGWIDAVTALLQDVYYAGIAPDRIGQSAFRKQLQELAGKTSRSALLAALDGMREFQRELQLNINRQLALESLYLSVAPCR